MKKVIILLPIILLINFLNLSHLNCSDNSKKSGTNKSDLRNDIIDLSSTNTPGSVVLIKHDRYKFYSVNEIIEQFQSLILDTTTDITKKLIIENQEPIIDLINSSRFKFLYEQKKDFIHFPIKAIKYNNSYCIVLRDLVNDNDAYNTFKLTDKEIAAKVLEKVILPMCLTPKFDKFKKDVKYIGISTIYTITNLSDNDHEYYFPNLIFIANIKNLVAFQNNKITQEELLKQSDVYMENLKNGDFRKVSIEIK